MILDIEWIEVLADEPNLACSKDGSNRQHGRVYSDCTSATFCQGICAADYPDSPYSEIWPDYGSSTQCWCNCYNVCDDLRCVAVTGSDECDNCPGGDIQTRCNSGGGNIQTFVQSSFTGKLETMSLLRNIYIL